MWESLIVIEAKETAVYSSYTLRELNSVVVYVASITVM